MVFILLQITLQCLQNAMHQSMTYQLKYMTTVFMLLTVLLRKLLNNVDAVRGAEKFFYGYRDVTTNM